MTAEDEEAGDLGAAATSASSSHCLRRPGRWEAARAGTLYYLLTTSVVLLGAWIGTYSLAPAQAGDAARTWLGKFSNVDGISHVEIVNWGYTRQTGRPPAVARFPIYPLLARAVKDLCGLEAEAALLLVAHVSLLGAFVLLARYVTVRWPDAPRGVTSLTLLALGLWPSTLFLRMAYTESLFLFAVLLVMYGMLRAWPSAYLALIVGFATGVRPVGVALVVVLAVYLWQSATSWRGWALRSLLLLPLACWGLIVYMIYLAADFGDPLSFATAHQYWVRRPTPWLAKLPALLTLEPIWSPYVGSSTTYWRSAFPPDAPWLNHGFMNPILFLIVVGLVVGGAWKRWLNGRECLLSALLLLIPYATMAYDNMLLSQPRFAAVVFPAYMVMARALHRLSWWALAIFFAGCAFLLGLYSAYFTQGYGQTYWIFW